MVKCVKSPNGFCFASFSDDQEHHINHIVTMGTTDLIKQKNQAIQGIDNLNTYYQSIIMLTTLINDIPMFIRVNQEEGSLPFALASLVDTIAMVANGQDPILGIDVIYNMYRDVRKTLGVNQSVTRVIPTVDVSSIVVSNKLGFNNIINHFTPVEIIMIVDMLIGHRTVKIKSN